MRAAEAKRSSSETGGKAGRLVKASRVYLAQMVTPSGLPPGRDGIVSGTTPGSADGRRAPNGDGRGPVAVLAGPGGRDVGPRLLRTRDAREWLSLRERCRRILHRAKSRAARIEEAAGRSGYESGLAEGRAKGREEGSQEAARKFASLVQRLEATLEEAQERRRRALEMSLEDTVKLALAAAEKVIRREVASGPEVTAAVVRSLLEEMPPATPGRVEVRLNPQEYDAMQASGVRLVEGARAFQLELKADPAVEPGGCRIESDFGWIDAGLETRLSGLAATLLDVMRHGVL